jgi:hypothetical protein
MLESHRSGQDMIAGHIQIYKIALRVSIGKLIRQIYLHSILLSLSHCLRCAFGFAGIQKPIRVEFIRFGIKLRVAKYCPSREADVVPCS